MADIIIGFTDIHSTLFVVLIEIAVIMVVVLIKEAIAAFFRQKIMKS